MANLSNINNKFLVTTGGNVLIGQTAAVGSSLLQVTGNSTFAGSVEIRSGNKLILQRPNNGVATEISTDSTGAMILNSINDEGFFFNNAGTNAFKLDPVNATFAGTVLIDGVSNYTGLEVKGAGASRPQIKFSNANQGTLAQIYGTESNSLVTTVPAGLEYQVRNANGASGDHVFKSYNTAILTLNGGTNAATFGSATYGSSLGQVRIINDAASNPASLSLMGYNNVASGGNYASIDLAMQSSGTGGNVVSSIRGLAVGTGENASELAFYTATSGVLTEAMRITNNTVIQLTSGINGYLNTNSIGMEMDINRNPETGAFKDAGLSHARIIMRGDTTANGGSNIKFVTSPTVNTVGTTKLTIAGDGKIQVGSDKVIWAGGYGGGLVIRQNNATGDRLIKMVTVDSTGAIVSDNVLVAKGASVGIGTGSPSRKLVVAQSDVTEPSGIDANTSILIKNNTWSGIQMLATEATGNFITFGDNVNGFAGRIQYSHATNAMQFETVGAERMRITAAGALEIKGSSTTASAQAFITNDNSLLTIGSSISGSVVKDIQFSSPSAMMYIDGSKGSVGIGTTSPDQTGYGYKTLTIMGGTTAGYAGTLELLTPSTTANGQNLGIVSFGVGGTRNAMIGAIRESANDNGTLQFWTSADSNGIAKRMSILANGNVIIGTETSTACTFKVSSTKNGSESSPHFCITGNGYSALHWLDTNAYNIVSNSVGRDIEIRANTNGVILTPGATAWASNSDIALKENINPLEDVLDKIKDYRCVEYNLKNSPEDKKIGFIAQDWVNDFSPIINKDKNDMLSMKYSETIPVLLKAIQELTAKVKELENK